MPLGLYSGFGGGGVKIKTTHLNNKVLNGEQLNKMVMVSMDVLLNDLMVSKDNAGDLRKVVQSGKGWI